MRERCAWLGGEEWEKKIMGPNNFLLGPTKTLSISSNWGENWMETSFAFSDKNTLSPSRVTFKFWTFFLMSFFVFFFNFVSFISLALFLGAHLFLLSSLHQVLFIYKLKKKFWVLEHVCVCIFFKWHDHLYTNF